MTATRTQIEIDSSRKCHFAAADCSNSEDPQTTLSVPLQTIEISEGKRGVSRITTTSRITNQILCQECKAALSELGFTDQITMPSDFSIEQAEPLSELADQSRDSIGLNEIIAQPPDGTIAPIITANSNTEQKTAAQIDRRPLITINERRKYANITLSAEPTGYQLTHSAVRELESIVESARQYANQDLGTQRETITAEIAPGESASRNHPLQRITVRDIVIEAGYKIMQEWEELFKQDALLARHSTSFQDSADNPPVPRQKAPDPAPASSKEAPVKHAPLADKQPDMEAASKYTSKNAIRVARHFDHKFTTTVCPDENTIRGSDTITQHSVTVSFSDGEPVNHECQCESSLTPCEHVAALLKQIPETSAVYVG